MNVKKIILIIYIILLLLNKTYYFWYPSINTNLLCHGKTYPNNNNEVNIMMKEYINKRTQDDINFFYLTDKDIIIAFQDIVKENEMKRKDMKKILMSPKNLSIIMMYKYIYNRARPSQVAPNIINKESGTLLESKTADTPSYPSGHAFQAYYLAKILSKKFPKKKEQLMKLARRVSDARIIAGLHFPSDRDFAYWLVDNLLN
jgi:membrane-associated phospholipid phosphatase